MIAQRITDEQHVDTSGLEDGRGERVIRQSASSGNALGLGARCAGSARRALNRGGSRTRCDMRNETWISCLETTGALARHASG